VASGRERGLYVTDADDIANALDYLVAFVVMPLSVASLLRILLIVIRSDITDIVIAVEVY